MPPQCRRSITRVGGCDGDGIGRHYLATKGLCHWAAPTKRWFCQCVGRSNKCLPYLRSLEKSSMCSALTNNGRQKAREPCGFLSGFLSVWKILFMGAFSHSFYICHVWDTTRTLLSSVVYSAMKWKFLWHGCLQDCSGARKEIFWLKRFIAPHLENVVIWQCDLEGILGGRDVKLWND